MVVVAELDDLIRILREEFKQSILEDLKIEIRNEMKSFKPDPRKLLNVKEAAIHFKVNQSTIRRWIKNGGVDSKQVGGTIYVKIQQ